VNLAISCCDARLKSELRRNGWI